MSIFILRPASPIQNLSHPLLIKMGLSLSPSVCLSLCLFVFVSVSLLHGVMFRLDFRPCAISHPSSPHAGHLCAALYFYTTLMGSWNQHLQIYLHSYFFISLYSTKMKEISPEWKELGQVLWRQTFSWWQVDNKDQELKTVHL